MGGNRQCSLAIGIVLFCAIVPVGAETGSNRELYRHGLTAYYSGDYQRAEALLTQAIEDGSLDARVYYYRGLALLASGRASAAVADFRRGAEIEYMRRTDREVNRALERIQGPARQQIERLRRDVKTSASRDTSGRRSAQTLRQTYGRGVTAYFDGDLDRSESLLTEVIDASTRDPRPWYFRGLVRARRGDTESAVLDLEQAADIELATGQTLQMGRALERVQGPSRQLVERVRRDMRLRKQSSAEMAAEMAAEPAGPTTADAADAGPRIIEPPAEFPASDEPIDPADSSDELIGLDDLDDSPDDVRDNNDDPDMDFAELSTSPADPGDATPADLAPVTSPGGLPIEWLHPDSELIIALRPSRLWNSAVLADLQQHESVVQGVQTMQQTVGLTPDDIELVLVGILNVAESFSMAPGMSMPTGAAPETDVDFDFGPDDGVDMDDDDFGFDGNTPIDDEISIDSDDFGLDDFGSDDEMDADDFGADSDFDADMDLDGEMDMEDEMELDDETDFDDFGAARALPVRVAGLFDVQDDGETGNQDDDFGFDDPDMETRDDDNFGFDDEMDEPAATDMDDFGFDDDPSEMGGMPGGIPVSLGAMVVPENVTIVILANAPIDEARLTEAAAGSKGEWVDHGNSAYLLIPVEDGPAVAVFLPNSTMLVVAEESRVQALLDDGPDADHPLQPWFIDPARDLTIAYRPSEPLSMPAGVEIAGMVERMSAFVIQASFDDAVDLEILVDCTDAGAPVLIKSILDGMLPMAQTGLAQPPAHIPAQLIEFAGEVLGSVTTTTNGNTFHLSATIPGTIRDLVQDPEIMGALMMGAMGAGPPAGGPSEFGPDSIPADGGEVDDTDMENVDDDFGLDDFDFDEPAMDEFGGEDSGSDDFGFDDIDPDGEMPADDFGFDDEPILDDFGFRIAPNAGEMMHV